MRLPCLKRRSFLALGLFPCVAAGAAELPKLPLKEKFHLYLLIGQSNMAGRGAMDEAAKEAHPRVLKFTKDNTWAPATDPLHFDKPIAGVGLGSSFGREMAEKNPDASIGLIPCAVGGTPLSRWVKGGDLYAQARERAQAALKDGTLKGILWHQGEADSGTQQLAASYGERLAQMVKDLRADLGAGEVPFVAGKLGEFLRREDKDGKPSYWPKVNEQIGAVAKTIPRSAAVESAGLKHKGDVVHFDTPSLRELGLRYAETMRKLQSAGK
jgi:Carbohydrate esterase, sialic acid-specific acetylesterase